MLEEFHHGFEKEDIEELLVQYQNLKQGKEHAFIEEDAFERIIEHFDSNDDLFTALEAASIGVDYFPYSSSLMYRKADLLLATRKYREALLILDAAFLLDNNNISYYILKTDGLLALDEHEEAIQILEESLSRFHGDEKIDLLFELADVYDDYEKFDKVFDCLAMILDEDPQNEEALYKICFWTDFTGRNEESVDIHKKILDDFPFNELAWFNLAAAFQGLKLYEKAIDAYQYAIAIDEKFDYAYRNMGDAFLRLRKYKDAIESLEKVLELSRPEEIIYEAIGHCFQKLGKFAQARFNYRKALHMNAADSRHHYRIGLTYMEEQQWDLAIKSITSALQISKNVADYNLAIGQCFLHLSDFKTAIQYFGIVIKYKPKSVSGWEFFVKSLYGGGFFEEAAEQSVNALNKTGGKPLFLYYYSASLFQSGKTKEALLQLDAALDAAPRLVKKFVALDPSFLQNNQVVDLIARYKKNKKL